MAALEALLQITVNIAPGALYMHASGVMNLQLVENLLASMNQVAVDMFMKQLTKSQWLLLTVEN